VLAIPVLWMPKTAKTPAGFSPAGVTWSTRSTESVVGTAAAAPFGSAPALRSSMGQASPWSPRSPRSAAVPRASSSVANPAGRGFGVVKLAAKAV
jgi:hypothetical protein